MTAPLVQAESLTRHFATRRLFRHGAAVQAVSGVSLAVAPGETVGLVGESGSGKSTVGRLLLGLLPATSGRALFDGVDLAGVGPAALRNLRRRMQLVFQDPYGSLDPRRRVGAQIADALVIHSLVRAPERAARVAQLLDQVGLPPDHAGRYPHEFSGGQRQRIGIARALASGPDFLVADEPVSALDVSVQAQVLALLADLRARLRLAMLFISHDLPVVRHLCDRVIVMYLGRIMEQGPVSSVFAAPAHPYTRALLSAAPSLHPQRRRTRILLQGEPPSPMAPPSGCVFRTRCPHALPACADAVPELRVADGRGAQLFACIRDDLG
jgi:oligopeptide/dipeptide ABC transporter ATP-binding protein